MENQDTFGIRAMSLGRGQRPGRRRGPVDLGIAFVGEDLEIVTLGQRDQLRPIGLIGHRPLRIGRGADIGDRRPVEDVVRQGDA
jgi:hypothetical protein